MDYIWAETESNLNKRLIKEGYSQVDILAIRDEQKLVKYAVKYAEKYMPFLEEEYSPTLIIEAPYSVWHAEFGTIRVAVKSDTTQVDDRVRVTFSEFSRHLLNHAYENCSGIDFSRGVHNHWWEESERILYPDLVFVGLEGFRIKDICSIIEKFFGFER